MKSALVVVQISFWGHKASPRLKRAEAIVFLGGLLIKSTLVVIEISFGVKQEFTRHQRAEAIVFFGRLLVGKQK